MKINNWSVVKSPIGISLMHIEDKRPTGLEVCISVIDGKVNINAYQDGVDEPVMEIKHTTKKKGGK